MKRYAETARLLLLAAASEGDLEYHLKIMRDAQLIDGEGITDKGRAILEPIKDERMYLTIKRRLEEAELTPELMLIPDLACHIVENLRELP